MKNITKKITSLILTIAILCTFLMPFASAAEKVTLSLANGQWDSEGYYSVDIVATGDTDTFEMRKTISSICKVPRLS